MITVPPRALVNGARLAGSLLAAALLVAACSSSTKSSAGTSTAAAGGGGSSGGSGSGVTVETHSGAMGTFLTDGSGMSLYMFASDTSTKSSCSGACATFWPPLSTSGTPTASGGATSSMLGTITRSDGSKQVTYAGHPLYTFKQDTAAGDTNGQGSSNFGAKWWLLAPSGQPITGSGGASSPTSSAPAASPSPSKAGGWA